jgi:hypothetical protein
MMSPGSTTLTPAMRTPRSPTKALTLAAIPSGYPTATRTTLSTAASPPSPYTMTTAVSITAAITTPRRTTARMAM